MPGQRRTVAEDHRSLASAPVTLAQKRTANPRRNKTIAMDAAKSRAIAEKRLRQKQDQKIKNRRS